MKYLIKSRIGALPGRTMFELLLEANKRTGYRMYQSDFSAAIHGKDNTPRAEKILEAADQILTEWEHPKKKEA